jgi:hypothetical protein
VAESGPFCPKPVAILVATAHTAEQRRTERKVLRPDSIASMHL